MPRSVQIPTPRPSRESLIKRLRIPKARQEELQGIMREPKTDTPAQFSNASFGELHLTAREKEVLELILAARSNREIARRLGVGERTVKAHVGRLMRKTASSKSSSTEPRENLQSAAATR